MIPSTFLSATGLLLMLSPVRAMATVEAGEVAVGMPVVDPSGGAVGVVAALSADNIAVLTDRYLVRIPKALIARIAGELVFNLSQGELDATVERNRLATRARAPDPIVTTASDESAATISIGTAPLLQSMASAPASLPVLPELPCEAPCLSKVTKSDAETVRLR